ncbi:MAG TPA: hypothetical protein VK002_08830 [Rubricoccaceae bacterium]|nr:hypothetical protein [Rubricoccaceae bacterium]
MKKFFALTTLCALFAVGFTLTGCAEETEIEPAEPEVVEPAPLPEPEPLPAPTDTTMMMDDTTAAPQM